MATRRRSGGINGLLVDEAYAHAFEFEGLVRSEARDIVAYLNEVAIGPMNARIERGIADLKSRGTLRKPWTLKQVQRTFSGMRDVLDAASGKLLDRLSADLLTIAGSEALWQSHVLDKVFRFTISVDRPAASLIRQVVLGQPFGGEQARTLREWVSDLTDAAFTKATGVVRAGLIRGDTLEQMTANVRRVSGQARNAATGLVRTSMTHVSSRTREEVYRSNSDIIKGVQWVSVLDARTTDTCYALDGQVFGIDEGPRPPAHFNCRSGTVPAIKSFEEIAGLSSMKGLQDLPAGVRASIDGQIPANVDADKWLRSLPRDRLDLAIGRWRAELFTRGKISARDLVDSTYQRITVDQILQRQGIPRADLLRWVGESRRSG